MEKDLLLAIRAALRSALGWVRDSDVLITPHDNFIPSGVKTSYVGIKDGQAVRTELTGGAVQVIMSIRISVFIRMAKPEAAIIGDDSAGRTGVLDAVAAVRSVLRDNLLSLPLQSATIDNSPQPGSELFLADGATGWQRQSVTLTYIWEE